ncbi:MAG: pyrimidine dimer DNA glycosylase/endonuclease V [Proteobacteria bacterium]|nr:pyrimidine dimer DNA glycosylase/endonuclease V [Pseudomonadota bacterium]MBU1058639.1 pyrimidine dimer DNA glycosylase/endonuclease V [Pseudomonadota bacterium]
MRLWSIHPSYLDAKGLVALWREGLLAQSVLLGKTMAYQNHPQLLRFKRTNHPTGAIASYLREVNNEARRRGYAFNRTKIINKNIKSKLPVTSGQIEYEYNHLLGKLEKRDKDLHHRLKTVKTVKLHPLFVQVKGGVEEWERVI